MAYYHLSFDKRLPATLNPRVVECVNTHISKPKYPEPEIARVCLAKSFEGCFMALYPNVSKFFEISGAVPYIDFFMYSTDDTRVAFQSEDLTQKRMVWDAHLTGEVWFTRPVRIKRLGKIRFMNTAHEPDDRHIYTHPFDNIALQKQYVSPRVEYRTLFYLTDSTKYW